jgi:EAL domain-containing protein (putative c-di-GMP-specific phosphodiesterase class I)
VKECFAALPCCDHRLGNLEDEHERALAMIQFVRLISHNDVCPYFQPIVDMDLQGTKEFEVLGRSRLFGLMSPVEIFSAASQLDMEAELSRAFRRQGAQAAIRLPARQACSETPIRSRWERRDSSNRFTR